MAARDRLGALGHPRLVFLPSAFFKIAQPKGFIEEWSKTYPAGSALPLGVIELTLFVLYLVPKTRYLGGLLMLAYLGGAVATHVHANDGMFFVPVIVGVVAWLGLYLRDRKLRALVPLVEIDHVEIEGGPVEAESIDHPVSPHLEMLFRGGSGPSRLENLVSVRS